MADIFSKSKRSQIMSAVKGRNTGPERFVRSVARRLGYQFQSNLRSLSGTPDLVFRSLQKVVFVHGCFWHGHWCKRGRRLPDDHAAYWQNKIISNKNRDKRVRAKLRRLGWQSLVIWECQLRKEIAVIQLLKKFLSRALN